MTDAITAGSILVEEGTHLPNSLMLRNDSSSNGWAATKDLRCPFEKAVQDAGWTFFFMAGEITATAFGSDRQKTLRTALKRLIADVKLQHCNSIEITQVTDHSFLTMPYVSITAHPRHVQKGMVFAG